MATGAWPLETITVIVEPYGAVPVGVVPSTAPATTVELYCAAAAGQIPTRWTVWRACTASLQLANELRLGMATGGGPAETTTPMKAPSLALTGLPPARGVGCWPTMRPAANVMLKAWPVWRTVKWSARTARLASGRDFPTRDGMGWLGVKSL